MSDTHTKELLDSDIQTVIDLCKNEILVPSGNEQLRQFILCPIGLVGAGKSTVVKPLSRILSLVRISGDEVRKTLIDNGFNTDRAWEVGGILIDQYARAGYSIVIDSDCAAPRTLEGIHTICEELNIPALWIHIAPPEEFIINKLRNYNHTWLFKDADHAIDVYQKRKVLHESLDFPFVYTFDTSLDTVDEQIKEACEVIREKIGRRY